jgi:hypothetical protein
LAVLKRLLVASMACSVLWGLQVSEDDESEAFKSVLVRLSGKGRMRRLCSLQNKITMRLPVDAGLTLAFV